MGDSRTSMALSQKTPRPGSVMMTPPGGAEGRGEGRSERTAREVQVQCTSMRSREM